MNLSPDSKILSWWLQGLKLIVPSSLKNIISPAKKRILIQLDAHQLIVSWPNKIDRDIENFDLRSQSEIHDFFKRYHKLKYDKHVLVLCLNENSGLRSEVNLPFKALSDLKQILDFEIARQTPFSKEQVYSGYRLLHKNIQTNSINVELHVVPRKRIEPKLSELQAYGIKPQSVELYYENDSVEKQGINVLPQEDIIRSSSIVRKLNNLLLFVVVVLSFVAVLMPFVNVEKGIKDIDGQIVQARAGAVEVNQLRSQWSAVVEQQNSINDIITNHRSSIATLNKLTELIPDDTWLTRLHIKGNVIRIQGESSTATALIPLIENSDSFSETRFQSPVTNNTSTGNDRFQITTKEVTQ